MIPFSDEELLKPVTASLQKVLPMLENDGGGMELLGIKKRQNLRKTNRTLSRMRG